MTGGTSEARAINRVLARVAQEHGLAMGLGSARALLEAPELLDTFAVRDVAPDIALLANLGAVQLNKGYGVEDCRRLVDMLQADALALHLNAVQEAVQPEGDTCFRDLLRKIEILCSKLGAPVVVKEVGWGIAPREVRSLFDAGVTAIDLAGAGGTSWSEVERYRIAEPWRANVAAAFAGWGIPTAECVRGATQVHPRGFIIASGGIAGGIDVVKALALGADFAGIAGPFLRAAAVGYEAASALAREIVEVLRIAMFALGEPTLAHLQSTKRIVRERDLTAPTPIAGSWRLGTTKISSVASKVVPGRVRMDLMRFYGFCRTTDDFGDESESAKAALSRLARWREETQALFAGASPVHPVLIALRETVSHYGLDKQPFLDLIAANEQDQRVHSYATWPQFEAYCMLSAAPVGRVVLRFFGIANSATEKLSDDVCIGLQLANHAQDVSRDAEIGRRYLLDEDVRTRGLRGAVHALVDRARALLASGKTLEALAPGPLRLQLALYRLGRPRHL